MSMRYFAMRDAEGVKKDCHEIKQTECAQYNKKHWGIFMTVNTFSGKNRRIENIEEICYWLCDIDDIPKEQQLRKIDSLAIKPNIIVESKRGFHCYWRAKNGTLENYERIERGIIKKLNGDAHCKDPVRLLRVPFFYHWKDIDNPYLITIKHAEKKSFDEQEMLYYFAEKETQIRRSFDFNLSGYQLSDYERIFKIHSVTKGSRNSYLFWVLNRLLDKNVSNGEITSIMHHLNSQLADSLSSLEINQMLRGKRVI